MNRYTYMENRHWRVKIAEQEIRAGFVDRLAEYESTGLMPDEIKQQLKEYSAYRYVCGGHSPEEIELAIRTRDGYDKNIDDAFDIIEDALDTLIEVGNGVTDEMLHKLCSRIFILRDIVVNKIGQEGDEDAERSAKESKKDLGEDIGRIKHEFNKQFSGLLPKELLFQDVVITGGNGDSR